MAWTTYSSRTGCGLQGEGSRDWMTDCGGCGLFAAKEATGMLYHDVQPGNTLPVPVDVAIDAIAKRGVAPFPAMGAPAPAVPAPQSPEAAQNPVTTPRPAAKPPAQ